MWQRCAPGGDGCLADNGGANGTEGRSARARVRLGKEQGREGFPAVTLIPGTGKRPQRPADDLPREGARGQERRRRTAGSRRARRGPSRGRTRGARSRGSRRGAPRRRARGESGRPPGQDGRPLGQDGGAPGADGGTFGAALGAWPGRWRAPSPSGTLHIHPTPDNTDGSVA